MRKTLINCLKFYPIIINLYIIIVMSLYMFEIKLSAYEVFGQSFMFNFLLLIGSFVFSFCAWHRILIYSMTLILLLETMYSIGLRIANYSYLCILIVLFSIILSSILYYKNGCYKKKEISRDIA